MIDLQQGPKWAFNLKCIGYNVQAIGHLTSHACNELKQCTASDVEGEGR